MNKILIIGLGTVGKALLQYKWDAGVDIVSASEHSADATYQLDISDADAVNALIAKTQPSLIINCAAMSNVDACEENPARARSVNALAVKYLANAAKAQGAGLVHISTDYVFNNDSEELIVEDAPVNPCSVYATTKLEAEHYAMSIPAWSLVIRTTWIFGGTRPDFVNGMIQRLSRGEMCAAVATQKASPVYAKDLAEAIVQLIEKLLKPAMQINNPYRRVFHVTNKGVTTRRDMAQAIATALEIKQTIANLKPTEISSWTAMRPTFTALSNQRCLDEAGFELRPWQDALDEYIQTVKLS